MAVEEHARHGRSNAGGHTLGMGTSLAGSLAYMCAGGRTDQRVSPLLLTTGHTGCHTYSDPQRSFPVSGFLVRVFSLPPRRTHSPQHVSPLKKAGPSSRTSHVVVPRRMHLLARGTLIHPYFAMSNSSSFPAPSYDTSISTPRLVIDTPTLRHPALSEPLAWLADSSHSPAPSYEINRPTRGNSIHTNFAIPSAHSLCSWTRCNLVKLPSTIIRDEHPPGELNKLTLPHVTVDLAFTQSRPRDARSRDDDPYILCDPVHSLRPDLVNLPSAIIANKPSHARGTPINTYIAIPNHSSSTMHYEDVLRLRNAHFSPVSRTSKNQEPIRKAKTCEATGNRQWWEWVSKPGEHSMCESARASERGRGLTTFRKSGRVGEECRDIEYIQSASRAGTRETANDGPWCASKLESMAPAGIHSQFAKPGQLRHMIRETKRTK
ncbi:hypothetical protein DFP72DRAFT_1115501 [Ephemerocybe angulata]|uniref:Uncharacterized protein n=1 Tax=Ephemerocybe angulata TaxID=980116 RepID=A0A8H6I0J5_9AGAR|nr:hypothetical protein DFP72DRAFT_1115501 [Tulosesus angulatus]